MFVYDVHRLLTGIQEDSVLPFQIDVSSLVQREMMLFRGLQI